MLSGTLLGARAITAAAEGRIHSVRLITREPPRSLAGAPYLVANSISMEGLNVPKFVFSGSARDAASGFPAHVNVAATLALAGIGRTVAEIWADPTLESNRGTVEGIGTRLASPYRSRIVLRTIPDGRITALSVLAALRKLKAPIRIGT